MNAVKELSKLGYTFSTAGAKIRAEFTGAQRPPARLVQPLLNRLRQNKQQALEYLGSRWVTADVTSAAFSTARRQQYWPAAFSLVHPAGHQVQFSTPAELLAATLGQVAEPLPDVPVVGTRPESVFPLTLYAPPESPPPLVPYKVLQNGWREYVVRNRDELHADLELLGQPEKESDEPQPALLELPQPVQYA